MMAEQSKNFAPLQTNTDSIVDQVMQKIIGAITSGQFKAGDKLPNEYVLIQELQVSRSSLREAMKIMSAMGIVEIKRGDGTYVCSQLSPSAFDNVIYSMIYDLSTSDELLEFRQILDEATVRLAMDKITREELAILRENVDAMRRAILEGNAARAQELDYQFHILLVECCKNVFFIRIAKGIYRIFQQSIGRLLRLETVDSKAPQYHQAILDCIQGKDAAGVQSVVSDSLITWRNCV